MTANDRTIWDNWGRFLIVPNCPKGGEKIEKEKANDSNSNHSYFIDVCFFI